MKIQVQVDATVNEKRRFIGQPDITPLIELASEMLDHAMGLVVEARLEQLEDMGYGSCDDSESNVDSGPYDSSGSVDRKRAAR